MSLIRAKWLAAGVVVVCGLCAGGRAGLLATADAQSKPVSAPADDKVKAAEEKLKQLQAELDKARKEAEGQRDKAKAEADKAKENATRIDKFVEDKLKATKVANAAEGFAVKVAQGEYDYVPASEMGTTKFTAFLREREAAGWEFKGEATLQSSGKTAPHWVFKRAGGTKVVVGSALGALVGDKPATAEKVAEGARRMVIRGDETKALELALEVELKMLKDKLAALEKVPAITKVPMVAKVPPLPVKVADVSATVKLTTLKADAVAEKVVALTSLAPNKSGANLKIVADAPTNAILLSGSPEAVKWAEGVIKSLDGK